MGLDINAYSHLRPVGRHSKDWCDDDHIRAFSYNEFPRSFRGIPVLGYEIRSSRVLDGGCYEVTAATETVEFRAGSYGGYGMWRDHLMRTYNPDCEWDKPFYELIWFADNEGVIGPEAAADLYADFCEHADVYAATESDPREQQYMQQKYQYWMRACELAKEDGLIQFH